MIPELPSKKSDYPPPVPDWLENGETPTPEQEREELLRIARIEEKRRADARAKADEDAPR